MGSPAWLAAAPQEGGEEDRIRGQVGAMLTANFKLGPFHMSPMLPVSGGVGSVPNERQQEDPKRNEIDGFVSASPALRAALPIGADHTVQVDVGLGQVWYRQFNQQDQTNYRASGRYSYSGRRMQLSLAESYFGGSYSRFAPVDDEEPPDPTLETDDWVPYKRWNTAANVSFSITERLRLGVGGRYNEVRFGEVSENTLADSEILGLNASLDTPVTESSSVGVVYDWARVEDPDPTSFRNADTQALGLRYLWETARSFSGDVLVGYRRIDPDDETVVGYRGFNYAAGLSGAPIERLQVGLQVSRNTFRSSYADNLYGVRQGGNVALNFAGSRHFRLTGRAQLYVHDYPEDENAASGVGTPREDVLLSYSIGASWSFARHHDVSFAIGRSERDSNQDQFDRVGLLLSLGYMFVY